jgi:hypothetical protein
MAPITKSILSLLLLSNLGLSAPVFTYSLSRRQLHGEGQAANSILTGTDNGVGYGTENAEDNTAALITDAESKIPARRQLHGEGEAADSILTGTDNGVGYGVENAEDNTASLITDAKSKSPVAAPTVPKSRRQEDKIANGAAKVLNAAGAPGAADTVQNEGDKTDGQLTDDAAIAGAQVGSDEEKILKDTGSDVPTKVPARLRLRQADKIANGADVLLSAAGTPSVGEVVMSNGDTVDGGLTDGAANVGSQTGETEDQTLENAGTTVPSKLPRGLWA